MVCYLRGRLRPARHHPVPLDDDAALDARVGRRTDQHRGHRDRWRGHCGPVLPVAGVNGGQELPIVGCEA